jgi:hypothetical protein
MTPNTFAPSLFPRQPARSPLNGLLTSAQTKPTTSPFRNISYNVPQPRDESGGGGVAPLPMTREPMPTSSPPPVPLSPPQYATQLPSGSAPVLPPVPGGSGQSPWQVAPQSPLIDNQGVWNNQTGQRTDPLAGLLDQSTQFQGLKKLTETVDEEPQIGGYAGGGGYADSPLLSPLVDPLEYLPYQPTRRYEVL